MHGGHLCRKNSPQYYWKSVLENESSMIRRQRGTLALSNILRVPWALARCWVPKNTIVVSWYCIVPSHVKIDGVTMCRSAVVARYSIARATLGTLK